MITKRVLVTEVRTADGGAKKYFGRFDAVAVASRGETILNSEFKKFRMSEEEFATIGKEFKSKGEKNGNC